MEMLILVSKTPSSKLPVHLYYSQERLTYIQSGSGPIHSAHWGGPVSTALQIEEKLQ